MFKHVKTEDHKRAHRTSQLNSDSTENFLRTLENLRATQIQYYMYYTYN